MLTKNAQSFKKYLENMDINLHFREEDDGETVVELQESLNIGSNLKIMAIFNKEDTIVSIYGVGFLTCPNESKRPKIYEMLNELNSKYTYFKFALEQNAVSIESFMLFEDNFNGAVIVKIILGMTKAIEDEYEWMMHEIWG